LLCPLLLQNILKRAVCKVFVAMDNKLSELFIPETAGFGEQLG